jgi:hypothetical protein
MIDNISNTINFSSIWQFVGPLIGVGFGYLISYKVWNRQRHWEMRRDVVVEVVQNMGELEMALIALQAAHRVRLLTTDEQSAQLMQVKREAGDRFDSCFAKYYRSMFSADLVAGTALSKKLSAYHQDVGMVVKKILSGEPEYFSLSETKQGLNEKSRAIIEAAQNALQIQIL